MTAVGRRPWTPPETQALVRMVREKQKPKAIAAELGRSLVAVQMKTKKLQIHSQEVELHSQDVAPDVAPRERVDRGPSAALVARYGATAALWLHAMDKVANEASEEPT